MAFIVGATLNEGLEQLRLANLVPLDDLIDSERVTSLREKLWRS